MTTLRSSVPLLSLLHPGPRAGVPRGHTVGVTLPECPPRQRPGEDGAELVDREPAQAISDREAAAESPPAAPVRKWTAEEVFREHAGRVYALARRMLGNDADAEDVTQEVLLQVVFLASGRIEVVRVVRGLGHGLDEAAVSAAEKIRFKPAQRDGQAVDLPATLHIVFQLAS